MRFRLVEAEKAEHSISRLCRVLGVTRQGFYAWRRRGPSLRQLGDDGLARLIVTIYDGSLQTYGAPRVQLELADQYDVHVGRKRVARLMRKLELRGVSRRGKRRTTVADPKAPPAPDLVERRFRGGRAEPTVARGSDLRAHERGLAVPRDRDGHVLAQDRRLGDARQPRSRPRRRRARDGGHAQAASGRTRPPFRQRFAAQTQPVVATACC